jgi:rhodanese-related sulfurtransferase/quercetin dioxygenase-like cupin family protein
MGPEKLIADALDREPKERLAPAQGKLAPAKLAEVITAFAGKSSEWIERVRLCAHRRWYERLYRGPEHDLWIISWLPGQSTGFHDHGESSGAFIVATGFLEEYRPGEPAQTICAGQSRVFGPNYAHDVRNVSLAPAVSIHAYSPPLDEMNEYEWIGDQLIPRDGLERGKAAGERWSIEAISLPGRQDTRSIEQVLAAARARLQRLSPGAAYEAVANGAVLVDIRPAEQRNREGSIPGAHVVERNVLEWRFDPASSAKLPLVTDHDLQIIVFCSEGYTSSLAAAHLQDLGLWRATDVVGGFHAWRAAGFTILPPGPEPS